MTTSEVSSESYIACERVGESCGFCKKLSEKAIADTLVAGGVAPNTARLIVVNSPEDVFTIDDDIVCDGNRTRAVNVGEAFGEAWLHDRESSFETYAGKDFDSLQINVTPIVELLNDPERASYFRDLTLVARPLTRGRFLDAARRHNVDTDTILSRMNELNWPTEQDAQRFTWREDRRFTRGKKLNFDYGEFITNRSFHQGSNNLIRRLQPGSVPSRLKYVERAKVLAPDLYFAVVDAMQGVEGIGIAEVEHFLRNSRGNETDAFLNAYRELYVLFGRLMKYEDIRSSEKDVAQELWT